MHLKKRGVSLRFKGVLGLICLMSVLSPSFGQKEKGPDPLEPIIKELQRDFSFFKVSDPLARRTAEMITKKGSEPNAGFPVAAHLIVMNQKDLPKLLLRIR